MGQYSTAPRQEVEDLDDNYVFVVPGHLHFSTNQMAVMTNYGQQPGVPFAISGQHGGMGRPDQLKFKLKFSNNLTCIKKNTIKLVQDTSDSSRYNLTFVYDAVSPAEIMIRLGVTDLSDSSKITFSYVETTWGPFQLSVGSNKEWNSTDHLRYVTENLLPSRRRKVTYANNYDIAISLTPIISPPKQPSSSSGQSAKELNPSSSAAAAGVTQNLSLRKFHLFSSSKKEKLDTTSPPRRDHHMTNPDRSSPSSSSSAGGVSTVLEQQIQNLRENQELQQQQIRRQQLLQLQLEQQLEQQQHQHQQEELQRSIRQPSLSTPPVSTSPSPPSSSQPVSPSSSSSSQPVAVQAKLSVPSSTSSPAPPVAHNTSSPVPQGENFIDNITAGFWTISRQISSIPSYYETLSQDITTVLTGQQSPSSNVNQDHKYDDHLNHDDDGYDEDDGYDGYDHHIEASPTDSEKAIDVELAMTGGRRHDHEEASEHYQMRDHYYDPSTQASTGEDNRRHVNGRLYLHHMTSSISSLLDGPPSPPTRLTSASFGLEVETHTQPSTSSAAIVRPTRPVDGIEMISSSPSTSITTTSITSKILGKFAPLAPSSTASAATVSPGSNMTNTSQIVSEVTYMRATGGSVINKPLGLRCYLQRVQHNKTVYYVNQVYGTENDANTAVISDRPDGQVVDDDTGAAGANNTENDNDSEGKPKDMVTMSQPDDAGGEECVICLSDPRTVALYPCRHTCLCFDCATNLSAGGNKCPICRRQVNLLLNLKPGAASSRATISLPDLAQPVNASTRSPSNPNPRLSGSSTSPGTPLSGRRASAVVPTSDALSTGTVPRMSVPGRRGTGVRRTY